MQLLNNTTMDQVCVSRLDGKSGTGWLLTFFFLSGFPALLYQVVWQRSLLTIYGVNIESVTMVVSAFMLGLGLGSLAGGWISERPGVPLLMVFSVMELGVAVFGFFSLDVFHFVAQYTAGTGALGTGAITFVVLLLPTALMGSTLPILTEHLVRISGNVGKSIGVLYFVNTLGSAVACFAAGAFIMFAFGESGSVRLAAVMNTAVGLAVLTLHFTSKPMEGKASRTAAVVESRTPDQFAASENLSFRIALPVAAVSGMVALGYEILWYRAFGIAFKDRAPVFATLLGFYLAGVAFGSLVSRSLCHRMGRGALSRHLRSIALFVILANLAGYLVLPAIGFLSLYHTVLAFPLISVAAALLGATFPLITHAAVRPDDRAGRGLSWLYLSNIIGSTLGSFLVGYVLMNIWPVRFIAIAIALTGLALGTAIALGSANTARSRMITVGSYVLLAIFVIAASEPLFRKIYERLEAKRDFTPSYTYRDLVESRSGVVAVTSDMTVYGGGCFDGKINTDLIDDTNMLYRPFSVSYWHPAPRDILVIGVATASWTEVFAQSPEVEKVQAVEINGGYLKVIARYPQVRDVLTNPKVSIAIDDGRRWLVHNREARFDVIVSNTTYNQRAHASNLLSVEFLKLIRSHLKPGGVFFYNLTNSPDAELTGLTVFPYGFMLGNHLLLSDSPFQFDLERWKRVMAEYRIGGKPVFDLSNPRHQQRFAEVIRIYTAYSAKLQGAALRASLGARRIITDDNMGMEWPGVGEILALAFHF